MNVYRPSSRLFLASVLSLVYVASAWASGFVNEDDTFLALRDAARRGETRLVENYAQHLTHYSLSSYVDYYQIQSQFKKKSDEHIMAFLQRYLGSAIANRLRGDWLLRLGKEGRWEQFDQQYSHFVLNNDLQIQCYALTSDALKGQNVINAAQQLLVSPKNYGAPCIELIATLHKVGLFDQSDVWSQIRGVGDAGLTKFAEELAPLVGAKGSEVAQAILNPKQVIDRRMHNGRVSHELFILALARLARSDTFAAVQALQKYQSHLPKAELGQAWAQIAYHEAKNLSPNAIDYWARAEGANLSWAAQQWKVRSALRSGNWAMVRNTIESMPQGLRDEPTWVYWLAQSLIAEHQDDEAKKLLKTIAERKQFYGQLAQEALGQMITVPQVVKLVTHDDLQKIAENPGILRALKLFSLGLRSDALREWNWQLRTMTDREHLVAAEFARQHGILDLMINTSERTKGEFDFNQRFPTPFRDRVVSVSEKLGLDMSLVYGLIRQESRFITYAKSTAGASGLMQLMPDTAKWVAKKIGLDNYGHDKINNLDANIVLGSNYLDMVLEKLDHSEILAAAAYNAGPGRPIAWRAKLTRTVPGAIFVETIPFTETRIYVKNVMSNAVYYAVLMEKKPQSLVRRLGTISPQIAAKVNLP